MTLPAAADDTGPESLAIRPPLQRRSREAWTRVLDAGVTLLEEGGYEAFTIAAVCASARVPPRAIYARAASKDAPQEPDVPVLASYVGLVLTLSLLGYLALPA